MNINDKVLTRCGKHGVVKYVGHMENPSEPALVYAGIELRFPESDHNGSMNGKWYFECAEDRGYFVPVHKIKCVLLQK